MGFCMMVTLECDHFPKHSECVGLCNYDGVFSGRKKKYFFFKFRLTRSLKGLHYNLQGR